MNLSSLPPHSRVWIYQADRVLNASEQEKISGYLQEFTRQWAAHGQALAAGFSLEKDRFIVLAVDENQAAASGCSIDSSVAIIKKIGEELSVDFFNRQLVAYYDKDEILVRQLHDFWALKKAGVISDDTPVFNNLVKNIAEFNTSWILPFGQSWHAEMFR